MRLSIGAAAVVSLAAWGCGPPEIVPVGPPGIRYEQITPEEVDPEEAAQALGETRYFEEQQAGAPTAPATPPAEPTEVGKSATTPTGLTYETLAPGSGAAAQPGQNVTVHYTGTLEDGTVFDSSRERGEPFQFRLGAGQVIAGWDQGVNGMRVGERRKLTIPGALAYGANPPTSKIPPNATLIFDVELLKAE